MNSFQTTALHGVCISAADPAATTSGAGESSDLPSFLFHFQPLFPPGGHHGGPRKLLVESKPLLSQDFIRFRPELSQSSDPSQRTRTELRGSAARSRCLCGRLLRRTARLATFGTPCTRGTSCLLLCLQKPLTTPVRFPGYWCVSCRPLVLGALSMSGSGRKDFDVKHILRLRWKLFSHPSPSSSSPAGGSCLQQDSGGGSFEHWGPSQSRLLKNQEKGSVSAFWKKPSFPPFFFLPPFFSSFPPFFFLLAFLPPFFSSFLSPLIHFPVLILVNLEPTLKQCSPC